MTGRGRGVKEGGSAEHTWLDRWRKMRQQEFEHGPTISLYVYLMPSTVHKHTGGKKICVCLSIRRRRGKGDTQQECQRPGLEGDDERRRGRTLGRKEENGGKGRRGRGATLTITVRRSTGMLGTRCPDSGAEKLQKEIREDQKTTA